MANYTKKSIKGTIIIFILTLFAAIIAYSFRILLARRFTILEYGSFYAILSFLSLFSIFQDLGLLTALTKYISEFKTKNNLKDIKNSILIVFIILLLVNLLLGTLFIIFSDYFALVFLHNINLSIYIKVCTISVMLSPLLSVFKAIFQGYHQMFYFSLIDFLQTTLVFLLSFIFIELGFGLVSPFLAYILMFLLFIPFYLIFIKKTFPSFWKFKFNFEKILSKKLIKFGLAVILTCAAGIIFNYSDTVMIAFFRSLQEVGLYNSAYPTAKVLWMLSGALTLVLLPISSELWVKKDIFRLKEGIKLLYKYSFILVIPASLVFFVFPDFILLFLFGLEYTAASNVLRLLSIGTIFYIIFQINNSILMGIGKPEQVSKVMLFAALLNLIGNFILIPPYGIIGATISTIISFIIIAFLSFSKLNKIISIDFVFKEFLLILFNSIVFLITLYLVKIYLIANVWIILITSLILGSIVYLIGLFLFKIITLEDIKMIINRLK